MEEDQDTYSTKELMNSETSDILFRGNDVFLNYIETEQLLKDVEGE